MISFAPSCSRSAPSRRPVARALFIATLLCGCALGPTGGALAVPFVRAFGLVFVQVHARDGASLVALLDTGASASAVDPRCAGDLPVVGRGEVVGTTGSLTADSVRLEGLRLGDTALPPLRATRRDLGGLLAPAGSRVDLILGSDAFAGRVLTLDFDGCVLTLSPASRSRSDGVRMRLDNGIPTLLANLAGEVVELRIDTGASLFATSDVYVNVPDGVWQALRARLPDLAPSSHFSGTGANGETVSLPVARLPGARIGPRAFDAVFVIVQPLAGYFASPDAKGFVGNNLLEKLGRVELDYAAEQMRAGR